jgi:hypothetical protein
MWQRRLVLPARIIFDVRTQAGRAKIGFLYATISEKSLLSIAPSRKLRLIDPVQLKSEADFPDTLLSPKRFANFGDERQT